MTNKEIKSKLIKVRKNIDINPTEKQKEYGNYKKGHIIINGFEITIENPKGSYRRGVDSNGKEWKTKMYNDYGYFLNSMGYDGDHIDVFLGNDFESKKIFVVDQKVNGKFDESKVMLGFKTSNEAKKAYLSNYEKDWKGFHKITEVDEETFKVWLYDGKKQRKPFYQYKDIKKVKIMTESILRQIIKESINKTLIKEARESTISTNKLIKRLYKVAQNYKRLYEDDDWTYLRALMDDLSNVPGVRDFNYGGGKYHQNGKEFGESAYKLYTVEIETEFDTIIRGEVYCNFAGTIDDPWSRYDMTVNFWRDSGINESKNNSLNNGLIFKDGDLRINSNFNFSKISPCLNYVEETGVSGNEFYFNDAVIIINKVDFPVDMYLEEHPLETWHDFGEIKVREEEKMDGAYNIYKDDKLYYGTMRYI